VRTARLTSPLDADAAPVRYLRFPLYNNGQCGISNAVMSVECGLGLAWLLGRVLVLSGNNSPSANLVSHLGVPNVHRARVTDLYEMPVPWVDAEDFDHIQSGSLLRRIFCSEPFHSALFYWPPTLDLDDSDLLFFANRRPKANFLTAREEFREVDVLEVTTPDTLSFFSYFFYLPARRRAALHCMLRRFRPKACYQEFAERVAAGIGPFNAAHVRLGDFRATFGTTTNDRSPGDVVQALAPHFPVDQTLVICTDESDNTGFFQPILQRYPRAVFLDSYILGDPELRNAFFDLPFHDDMALALVTQLVAAASEDFVGSMTSTFTAMIQRMRGNSGRAEDFKFLWNEIPDPGHELARGSHAPGKTTAFDNGHLVETRTGPYSWNRLDLWVGCEYYAWFREWPESFLQDAGARPETGETSDDTDQERVNATVQPARPAQPMAHRELSVMVYLRGEPPVRFRCMENDARLRALVDLLKLPRDDRQPRSSSLLAFPGEAGMGEVRVAAGCVVAIATHPPLDPELLAD
jgi:hypothetical protein